MELETISIRERIKQDLADILPLYKLDDLKKLRADGLEPSTPTLKGWCSTS